MTGDSRKKNDVGHSDQYHIITSAYMEEIAEKAALKAIESLTGQIYRGIGKSVLNKIFYFVGACTLWGVLKQKGLVQ